MGGKQVQDRYRWRGIGVEVEVYDTQTGEGVETMDPALGAMGARWRAYYLCRLWNAEVCGPQREREARRLGR